MHSRSCWVVLLVTSALLGSLQAMQQPPAKTPPTSLPGATSRIYKTVGETKLYLHVFQSVDRKPEEKRAAIVFFFGGGWTNGSVGQFVKHSEYLAKRGMVAIVADYRVKSRQGVTPFECVSDAKSAIRWVRAHAEEFGIDPQRIAAGGGSAGGHLAACTALLIELDETTEDTKVSSVPNALVLFNPALDLVTLATARGESADKVKAISPHQHIKSGVPPTIIFHGKDDKTVPFKQVTAFAEAMKKAGNRCEVKSYPGKAHGFFNYGRGDGNDYRDTLRTADAFLASLGYLQGEPTLKY